MNYDLAMPHRKCIIWFGRKTKWHYSQADMISKLFFLQQTRLQKNFSLSFCKSKPTDQTTRLSVQVFFRTFSYTWNSRFSRKAISYMRLRSNMIQPDPTKRKSERISKKAKVAVGACFPLFLHYFSGFLLLVSHFRLLFLQIVPWAPKVLH